jgi:hypothetical protein
MIYEFYSRHYFAIIEPNFYEIYKIRFELRVV